MNINDMAKIEKKKRKKRKIINFDLFMEFKKLGH